jgi:hypothetical protein
VLHVSNVTHDFTGYKLREGLEANRPTWRVKKMRNSTFVHFGINCFDAVQAMEALDGCMPYGVNIQVSL